MDPINALALIGLGLCISLFLVPCLYVYQLFSASWVKHFLLASALGSPHFLIADFLLFAGLFMIAVFLVGFFHACLLIVVFVLIRIVTHVVFCSTYPNIVLVLHEEQNVKIHGVVVNIVMSLLAPGILGFMITHFYDEAGIRILVCTIIGIEIGVHKMFSQAQHQMTAQGVNSIGFLILNLLNLAIPMLFGSSWMFQKSGMNGFQTSNQQHFCRWYDLFFVFMLLLWMRIFMILAISTIRLHKKQ